MKAHFSNSLGILRAVVAGLSFSTAVAWADVEDRVANSFKVEPGGLLTVEVDRGSIDVKATDGDSVEVEVLRKAGGRDAKARATLKDHVVSLTQEGNNVKVHAEYKGSKSRGWFGKSPDLQVKFILSVPRKFNADLKTAGGHVNVAGLAGKLKARTSGGHLKFEKIEGPITARTSGGSVAVAHCKGKVEVETSGGHLALTEIEGDVSAKTSGGSIRVGKVIGKCVVKTSGGGIESGDIKGTIEATTSGGSITAALEGQPMGDCSFKTSAGSITVNLDEKVSVDVNLHTSAGRISTDFPITTVIQGDRAKDELCGKINGGGPLITAHTSAGSVRLRKK